MKNWHVLLPEKDRNLVAMRKEIVFKHQEINISTNISPKGEDFGKTCFIKTHGKKMCFHGFFFVGTRHDPMCCQLGNQLFERKHPGRGRMVKKETIYGQDRKKVRSDRFLYVFVLYTLVFSMRATERTALAFGQKFQRSFWIANFVKL